MSAVISDSNYLCFTMKHAIDDHFATPNINNVGKLRNKTHWSVFDAALVPWIATILSNSTVVCVLIVIRLPNTVVWVLIVMRLPNISVTPVLSNTASLLEPWSAFTEIVHPVLSLMLPAAYASATRPCSHMPLLLLVVRNP